MDTKMDSTAGKPSRRRPKTGVSRGQNRMTSKSYAQKQQPLCKPKAIFPAGLVDEKQQQKQRP